MRVDPLPPAAPRLRVNAQTWESLSFLHWPVPATAVRDRLPPGLEVDERDGATWLGVVPFGMADVRVPPLPAPGRWGRFPELNARVYVRDRAGRSGVWFLALWCTNPAFIAAARALGIPYRRARASVDAGDGPDAVRRYRFAEGVSFRAAVRPAAPVDASSGLDAWLTARWNMYSVRAGRLWRHPVTHEPWTLRAGVLEELQSDVHARLGLPDPVGAPLVHVAEPVHALVGPPRLA